ncbi:translation initiation factor IF-2-like [Felis catus]|uniref:translation initiation factor IF-2-like n=1 Tax=Felis catus TaxID=9685 RepID=UPI001D19A5FD|nr:translation initiation factor IF-2-like [Felis catus]
MSTEFHNFAKKLIHRSPEQLFFVYREGLKTAETCIRDLGGQTRGSKGWARKRLAQQEAVPVATWGLWPAGAEINPGEDGVISCGLLRFRSSGRGSRTKGFRVVREGRGQAGRSGLAPGSESSGGGEGSARRQPREGAGEARRSVDNGIPGTKHNNKAFAFINRAPAAASGSPAGGGVRRRSAAEAPHHPPQVGPRCPTPRVRTARPGAHPAAPPRVWVPGASPPRPPGQSAVGPGCEAEGRGRDGRGGEVAASRGAAATRSAAPRRPFPGSGPHGPGWHLALGPAPGLCAPSPQGPRKDDGERASAPPAPLEDGRRAFCSHALSPGLRPTPSTARGPLEAAAEPRPGSWRLLGRNPVPAWLRLGFAPAKQEMRCSRCTSLLRNSSAGVFLRSAPPPAPSLLRSPG